MEIAYRIVLVVALLTLLGAGGWLANKYIGDMMEDQANEERSNMVGATVGVNTSGDGVVELSEEIELVTESKEIIPSLKALYEANPDTVGWVKVDNSNIDYVVVQRPIEDEIAFYNQGDSDIEEEYYLHKDFDGNFSYDGTIFALFSNKFGQEGLSRNTILFGHHMRSGMMFQNIMKYDCLNYSWGNPTVRQAGLDFYKQNPIVLFDTLYEEARWVVFAVVKGDPYAAARATEINWMITEDPTPEQQQAFIDNARSRSVLDTYDEVEVTADDHILIMQTCSYEMTDVRTLVFARKLREGETTIDVSGAHVAENPIFPARLRQALGY